MQRLYRKRIVLGVGGGIAAYKSAELVRRLLDQGAEVRVVMTRGGSEFITPLTMQALSGHPVHLDLLDPAAEAAMGHIELAKWADLVLIAPATADLIARLAQGIADDLLTTLVLATDATVAIAPAMNQAMWRDPATQANTQLLQSRGLKVFGPASGSQACGDVGMGRMLEATDLALCAAECFQHLALTGKHVLITAGPTHEPIDPVRYIANRSSGKQGYAIAAAAAAATVTTRAGWTRLHRARLVDDHVAAAQGLAVHAFDGSLRLGIAAHLDKAKAFGTAGVALHHHLGAGDSAELTEGL